jgi:hypothetical protein
MPRHKIDDINIGDKIYYEDDYLNKAHSLWTVVGKLDQSLLIEIIKEGKREKRLVELKDAKMIIPQTVQ